jgi:hypothetical protein
MRLAIAFLLIIGAISGATSGAFAQTQPDPVLARMVPPGTVSLLGARMDQIKATQFYQRLIAEKKLPDLDRFTRETGFDPRRDVRELLVASNTTQGQAVALARGTFNIANFGTLKTFKHGIYVIHGDDHAGFCFLDGTTAAAGPLTGLYAALDHWHSGAPPATPELLKQAAQVPLGNQIWAVSQGGFNLPGSLSFQQGGTDFAQIFRGVETSALWANLSGGLNATITGNVKTEADAKNLGDAARGLIGIGRLSVPEAHKELLKLWDGFHVDQQARHITITINVAQDMIDHLVDLLQSGQLNPQGHVDISN